MSIVLHALLMVTLGSLAVATGSDNLVMELVLTAGNSADGDDDALDSAGGDVSVAVLEADPIEVEELVEKELPLEPAPDADDEDAPEIEPEAIDDHDSTGGLDQPVLDDGEEANPTEHADDATAALDTDSTPSPMPDPSTANASGEADDVVERFIQYDVGQLSGEEGNKARQDFGELGVSAIPALVRGINRAAMMSQSCPVVVIRGKLAYELQRCGDASLINYARENLGRDVPRTAPHYGVINQLRRQCPSVELQREAIVKLLRDNQLPASEELVARVFELSHANAGSLAEATQQDDTREKLAAAVAFCKIQPAVTVEQQIRMGNSLTKLLAHPSLGMRRVAHRTLVTLADGADFGPRANDSPRQTAEAQMRWEAVWQRRQIFVAAGCDSLLGNVPDDGQVVRQVISSMSAQDVSKLRPEQRVKLGRFLTALYGDDDAEIRHLVRDAMFAISDGSGGSRGVASDAFQRRGASQQYWRDYWDRYETKRINESRSRSMLAMAKALARQGNMSAARRRFREIAERYPDTLAAISARRELGSAY